MTALKILLITASAPALFAAINRDLPLYFRPVGPGSFRYAAMIDSSLRISANRIDFGANGQHIDLLDAHSCAASQAEDPVSRLNIFTGRDSASWHTDLPLYRRIRYGSIYPGIDILYYGNAQGLEYDFELAPGADPSRIRLGFPIDAALELTSKGDLLVSIAGSLQIQHRPRVYQGLRTIASRYVIDRRHKEVRIALGAYDRSQRLTIDPVLAYGAAVGSLGAWAVAVDEGGNAYVLAQSSFIPGDNAGSFGPGGTSFNLLLLKIDPTGGRLLYAVILGGSDVQIPGSVAIDRDGSAYVTGTTYSADFPTTAQAFLPTMPTAFGTCAFVAKIAPDGESLVYSTFLGGPGASSGYAIAVDGHGNAIVTGVAGPPYFPLTAGSYASGFGLYPLDTPDALQTIAGGFLTKVDTTGSALLYSTLLNVTPFAVTLDETGAAYVAGTSLQYLPQLTQYTLEVGDKSSSGVVITRINSAGDSADFTIFLGCMLTGFPSPGLIALDSAHNIIVAGTSSCASFPGTSGAFQPQHAPEISGYDGLIVKIASDASTLLAATFLGGGNLDEMTSIGIASDDSILLAGGTSSSNFPVTADALQPQYGGGDIPRRPEIHGDGFFARLSPNLDRLLYSTYLGGSGSDSISALAVDIADNVYLAGSTLSSNSPRTANAFSFARSGPLWALKLGNDTQAPPILSNVAPPSATAGSHDLAIQIAGANFAPNAVLFLNGSSRPSVFNNESQLTAIIAAADLASTGPLELRILNPGSGGSNAFFLPVEAPDGVNPNPRITGVLPSGIAAGSAGQNIQVRGSGFLPSTVASINGKPRNTAATSDSDLSVFLNSDDLAAAGSLSLILANPAPGGGVSNSAPFQISSVVPAPPPSISNLSPSTLPVGSPSTKISIAATGLTRSTVARWNGVDHPISIDNSGNPSFTASAADLAHAGTAEITVYDPATALDSNPLPFWIPLPATGNDLTYSPLTRRLYLSMSTTPPGGPGSIAVINPSTGDREATFSLGASTGQLAVSSGGSYLYVALTVGTLRRYTLLPASPWLVSPLDLPTKGVVDFAPVPGKPNAVAVAYATGLASQVTIVDDDAMRPSVAQIDNTFLGSLQFSEDGSTLYVAAGYPSFSVVAMSVTDSGVRPPVVRGQADGDIKSLRYFQGRFYSSLGSVFDAATLTRLGQMPASSYASPLATAHAIVMLTTNGQADCSLQAFDPMTFAPLWETSAGCVGNAYSPASLLDIGGGFLALGTTGVFIVKQPIPAPLYSLTTPEPVFKRTFELGTAWDPENELVVLAGGSTVPVIAFLTSNQSGLNLSTSQSASTSFVLSTPGWYSFTSSCCFNPTLAGEYTGSLSILLSNTTNAPLVVPYEITVIDPYPPSAPVDSLVFTYRTGDKLPNPQSIALTKDGKLIPAIFKGLPYPSWITVQSGNNSVPGTITIGINPAGLASGPYSTSVVYGYSSTSAFDVTIPVTLQVTPQ